MTGFKDRRMMKVLICLTVLVLPVLLFAQQKVEPIEYTKGDVEFNIIDTLYLPIDTVLTIRYQMINNSAKDIRYGEDYVEQEFISNSGWKDLEYPPVQFNTNDSVTVIREVHLIAYPLIPQYRREHSTSFSGVYNQIYEAGEKYRLIMTFNFEGERGKKYYIWDELEVASLF